MNSRAQLPSVGVPIGRIPVTKVTPVVEGGAYPAKASLGEEVRFSARVFREGHDAVAASVVLHSPTGRRHKIHMRQVEPWGLDIWEAWIRLDEEGPWTFRVEGWSDPWGTWLHHAETKLPQGIDVALVCAEGRDVLRRGVVRAGAHPDAAVLQQAIGELDPERPVEELIRFVERQDVRTIMDRVRPRALVSPTPDHPIHCDRPLARFSAWYEFFPRSQGASQNPETGEWTSGTFDSSHATLEHAADLGFDVIYLPPIHPIGSAFKKGKNNTLDSTEADPGSPWAIGSPDGGHDAIHPDLGDEAAFARFMAKARSLGLEVALDLALQCSPDHPWVAEHPDWFGQRADGTIAFAENPPKKYQDIYPVNFDRDPGGISAEVLRVVKLWISRGVTVFRVDNPHTKPINFWAWLLHQVRLSNPEVIFLAEAFTRPEMMHMLGKVGFQQSYTYFTWRNTRDELQTYLGELSQEMADFYRPNFWPNTPDINPAPLHSGNPAAFRQRVALAGLLSPSWGMYSGLELCEHELFRREEYLDSEKYEYRPRDFSAEGNINSWIRMINELRRTLVPLQQLRRIHFHGSTSDDVLVFSKRDGADTVLVVCSLNPDHVVEAELHLDRTALGWPVDGGLHVVDHVRGETWLWGPNPFVSLSPEAPLHVLTLSAQGAAS